MVQIFTVKSELVAANFHIHTCTLGVSLVSVVPQSHLMDSGGREPEILLLHLFATTAMIGNLEMWEMDWIKGFNTDFKAFS